MRKEEFYYDSFCNTNKIHAVKWVPEGTPLCIVQIVHGMAEHMGRYEEFAAFLTKHNILVVGEDHLGHGLSMGSNPPGYFCEKEPHRVLVEDVRKLKDMVHAEYPGTPYVLLGHSMGSFIVRNFIHVYSKEVDGVILTGTGMLSRSLLPFMKSVAVILTKMKGSRYVSPLVKQLVFGSYLDRVPQPCTQYDWLTTDEEKVQEYMLDPLCAFSFTLNGFVAMAELIKGLYNKSAINTIRKDFPMFVVIGDEDPVGDYGVSAHKSCRMYSDAGMKRVTNKVYPGKRHELLHEDIRDVVMEDMFMWINKEVLR